MKIECKTTFLDGVDRFEEGDQRTVDDTRGAKFIGAGWACEVGGSVITVPTEAVTLSVHNGAIGLGDSNG